MVQRRSIGIPLLAVHRRDSVMMHLSSRTVSRVCFAKSAQGRNWLCQSNNTSLALCHRARGLHSPARREQSGLSCRGVSERRQQPAEQGSGPISEDELPAEIDRWSPKALLEPLTPHMLMVSVQLSFSVWYVLGRLVLSGGSDPLTFALLRETVSSCLLLYLGWNREGDVQLQSSEDAGRFLLLGFLSFVNISGFTAALALVSEFNCAIVQPIVPVVALGLSALLGKEKFSASSGVGLAFSVTGAILVTALGAAGSTGEGVDSSSFIIGNLCLLAQVFGLAGLMVCMSDVSSRYPPLTTTAWYYTISSVMCGVAVFQAQGWQLAPLLQELHSYNNIAIWGTLLYVIVFATVFNYSAMTSVSKQLPPSNISAYTTLQPFLVAGLSYVAFGTEVSDAEIAASTLIVLGLFISILPPDLFAKLLGKGDSGVAPAASMKQQESLPARAAAMLESLAEGAYDLTCDFLPSEMQLRRWNKAAMRRLQLAFLSEEEAIKARQRAEEGEVPEWVQEMLLHLDDKRPIGRSPRRY